MRRFISITLKNRRKPGIYPAFPRWRKGCPTLCVAGRKADDRLQVMTIHKAKGLEFDWVIVPGLGRSPRSNDKKLFMWMETVRSASVGGGEYASNDLLLAPIQETGAAEDPIYLWLENSRVKKNAWRRYACSTSPRLGQSSACIFLAASARRRQKTEHSS